ncbi:LytR/AlgR family response regulator transcription factor [Spirosoma luteum]|uniref:LytR/AlgR family response regulator transcription factor n=1 Tax=Spirosoma luteum TaxID=431553 RepID=UPI0003664008|nr:LytTR family DNA-binding domain-containing protein [Spirosoma luteum]
MLIQAIALDDELPALEIIEAFCNRIEFVHLQKTFTRTLEAHRYLTEHPVDLLFLDINMPAQSGMDFYRAAIGRATPVEATPDQERAPAPLVIFTTAYSAYAVESYELQAVDYLLKPFTFERFLQAVQRVADQRKLLQPTDQPRPLLFLLFRVDYGLVKVMVDDILFIEGLDNYLKIHLENQKPVVVRLTMKAMMEKLPPSDFVRVHRSYIVALRRIEFFRNKLIAIGGEEIPLGSSYEESFFALFGSKA